MKEFKTPKGTVLPLLDMRGKPYLQVAHRLVWFREECPKYSIETEFVSLLADAAMAKATIKDETGRILSTAHKTEDRAGFSDFIEKSETGAVGRALAMIGYGTQFCADELDEGKRLADSPVKSAKVTPIKPAMVSVAPAIAEARGAIAEARKVTTAQLTRLFAIQNKTDWKVEDLKAFILKEFGLTSSKELTMSQYDRVVAAVQGGSPPNLEPGSLG